MINSNIEFIDFGAGKGESFNAASAFSNGDGIAIDISPSAISSCKEKGIPAEQIDVLKFDKKNAATASFAFNLLQEMPGRADFRSALFNIIRSSRDYSFIQHPYFDQDTKLIQSGLYVPERFGKKILYKPTISDYVELILKNREGLAISGLAIFVSGSIKAEQFDSNIPTEEIEKYVPRTIRIIVGRKNLSRFRPALAKMKENKQVYLWEGTC